VTKKLFFSAKQEAVKAEYLTTAVPGNASVAAAETLCEFDTDFLCGMVYTSHDNLTIKD
jgi:hypothetical protein